MSPSSLPLLSLALLASLSFSSSANAQALTDPDTRMAAYERHVKMTKESPYGDLKWQFVGPTNVSGRVTDVALTTPRGKTYTIYVAAATGGVWKSDNEGTTWEPIFEHAASTCIGDIALDPSNQDVVWVGTGEANIFRSSMAGCGVYKSTDRGATWQHMGLTGTHTISRIVVHPANSDIVYVAASGHEWTNHEERGVYRTADGGKSWEKVLYINDKTGAIDLVMDPEDPKTLYAATWQRIRKRWHDPRNEPDYSGSGIHRSTDGGSTWESINKGLPKAAHRGRIGIDLCRDKPNTLYAFVDSYEPAEDQPEGTDSYGRPRTVALKGSEIYRSDDRGMNWRKVSKSDRTMRNLGSTYGWVFGQIRVDPKDENTIYVMGLGLNVSNDGGQTFRRLRGMHGDHHALWIDPDNTDYLVNGNDGGVYISYDTGKTWRTFTHNLPVVQFYNVGMDMDEPFRVYGSIQDHGSRRATVTTGRSGNIRPVEFEGAPGGEASSHCIDPTDPDVVYSAGFYGRISRSNLGNGERARVAPSAAEGEAPLRGQWLAPFILSPHNPRIVYHGMNYLYRSLDRGNKFERISPDLTSNDPDQLGDIQYQTLFSISESPLKFGLIYTGSDDGHVYRTPDGGRSWQEITRGLAPERWISRIVASRYDENTVYVSQNGKRNDDFAAYLWKSTDRGETWTSIVANIPMGPINVVREDPTHQDILYVGTDLGAYVSTDGAKSFQALAADLPTTYVHDLDVHPRDNLLVIATHGRGIYALDAKPIQAKLQSPASPSAPSAESSAEPVNPEETSARLAGTWRANVLTEEIDNDDATFSLVLTVDSDGKIGGELRSIRGESKVTQGSIQSDGTFELTTVSDQGEAHFEGKVEGRRMKGKMIVGDGAFTLEFEARRTRR